MHAYKCLMVKEEEEINSGLIIDYFLRRSIKKGHSDVVERTY